jgi:hypothetical protein
MLYDPENDEHMLLYEIPNYMIFEASPDGQVAFFEQEIPENGFGWDRNTDIFLIDAQAVDEPPVNLSEIINLRGYPLGWSQDGSMLALAVYVRDDDWLIYVWDGETAINITPDGLNERVGGYDVDWGVDGRLAFTVSPNEGSEIYIWDGDSPISLSQNAIREPRWNANGELAFLSASGIAVWDGISMINGRPDEDSFTIISSELIGGYSSPQWMPDGRLMFAGGLTADNHMQIYR